MEMRFFSSKIRGSKILAFADVTLGEGIIMRGFRIVDGEKGLFAAVPSRSYTVDGSPRFVNQVVFATPELRDRILGEILAGYRRWRAEGGAGDGEPPAADQVADPVPF